MTINIIHDGDHGGDDFITTLLFLANPDLFKLRAITTNFGNVSLDVAAMNAQRALDIAGQADLPVYKGADKPFRIPPKAGDDAFGENGIGDVALPPPSRAPQTQNAIDYMIETLEAADAPLTICPTGPLTNMALLLERAPHLKSKIKELVVMGGGGARIAGNITPFAEFNFYMDPDAADFVLKSGVNIVLHGLSTTHQVIYAPDRHADILAIPQHGEKLSSIMRAAEHLDIKNFGETGAYMHDENVAVYLAHPECYETQRTQLSVNTDSASPEVGNLVIGEADESSSVKLVTHCKDPDAVFRFIATSLVRLFTS